MCFFGTKMAYTAVLPASLAYTNHMTRDRLLAAPIKQKWRNSTYFVVQIVKRRKMSRRLYPLVEIRRDLHTPVVSLSGEPPRDPNQLDAMIVIDYNRLTPGSPKKCTHIVQKQNPANRSPGTRISSCSAWQPGIADEVVTTERSHDLKF